MPGNSNSGRWPRGSQVYVRKACYLEPRQAGLIESRANRLGLTWQEAMRQMVERGLALSEHEADSRPIP